jgi:anti-sigma factor RsiW
VVAGSVTGWLGTGVSLALAASLRFVVAMPSDRAIQQESIPGHVRSLLATHLTDLTTSEEHTVKPWFNGKLDVSPLVIDPAPQGFPSIAVGSIIFTTASPAL